MLKRYCNHWLTHVSDAADRAALEGLIPDSDDEREQDHPQQDLGDMMDMAGDPGADEGETMAVVAGFDAERRESEAAAQAPMMQAPSPEASAEESEQPAAAAAAAVDESQVAAAAAAPVLTRQDTLPLSDGAIADDNVNAALAGCTVYIDPESYSEAEVNDLTSELLTNGANVVSQLDLTRCTHVLCECVRTQAFEHVANQPEDCDVVCANGQWLRVCIKQTRRVGIEDYNVDHLRYQPHQAVPTENVASQSLLPGSYTDHWDGQHVKLPCSPRNALGEYSKWSLIHHHLSQPLPDFAALESAIRHIHARRKHDFAILRKALDGFPEEAEFYESALPMMTALALGMPQLFAENGVTMLVAHVDKALTLTQREVACLLSAAFFCLFPGRVGKASYKEHLPSINFDTLFAQPAKPSWGGDPSGSQIAKLRCVLHYFVRVSRSMPVQKLTFHRRVVDTDITWLELGLPVLPVRVVENGMIEDADDCIQADFANEFVGGGVLGRGAVQEEIRFAICAELIVSRLFTQQLQGNEVLMVYGAERFCSYSGYGGSFRCMGDFEDETDQDESTGHIRTVVAAMDALNFGRGGAAQQYSVECCERESGKAFAAFSASDSAGGEPSPGFVDMIGRSGVTVDETVARATADRMPIATGNWGCGVFGGDKFLKALLQANAATAADRPLLNYHTVGETALSEQLRYMFEQISERAWTVGDVWAMLAKYRRNAGSLTEASGQELSFGAFLLKEGLLPDADEDEGDTEEEEQQEQEQEEEKTTQADAGATARSTTCRSMSAVASSEEVPDSCPEETKPAAKQTTLDAALPEHAARARQVRFYALFLMRCFYAFLIPTLMGLIARRRC